MSWNLPSDFELPSGKYAINTDFRDILEIISYLQDEENTEYERIYIALALFYVNFEKMPKAEYQLATDYLLSFINCGEIEKETRPQPKQLDWEQDAGMIAADINKVVGYEIRALPFLHWYTFIAYFNGIGEGQLATVVSIREKRRKGQKLEKWEQEFYQNNKSKVDFKKKYSAEDLEEIARLKEILGE